MKYYLIVCIYWKQFRCNNNPNHKCFSNYCVIIWIVNSLAPLTCAYNMMIILNFDIDCWLVLVRHTVTRTIILNNTIALKEKSGRTWMEAFIMLQLYGYLL